MGLPRLGGHPEAFVRVHDFRFPELGRASPYGVYDIAGWASVGIDQYTATSAGNAIRRRWQTMEQARYPAARSLLVTADCRGSNGARARLCKRELQVLGTQRGLTISICHLPPGTSQWNRIEHRLFSFTTQNRFITQNWRGKPPVSYQAIVPLIAATTTRTGLDVKAEIDPAPYPAGVKGTDEGMAAINLNAHAFHGEWNYAIAPRPG